MEFAATRTWTFAKTYAEFAPHDYVVDGRTPDVFHEDLLRAARVIHTFGSPGDPKSPDGPVPYLDTSHPRRRRLVLQG